MTVRNHESILLNSATIKAGDVWNLTEWTDYSWARELTFTIDVQQTIGNPTAGQLLAKFQRRSQHKNGAIQYSTQRLVDFTADDIATMLPGTSWPSPIADFSMASPVNISRTLIRFGPGVNLQLSTSGLAGGANPGFQTTVVLTAKE